MSLIELRREYGIKNLFRCSVEMLLSQAQRRHLARWWHSLQNNYLLDTPFPWITFDAVDFVAGWLPSDARVFEYGSGGSTLFWLSRGATCVSVEHDPLWYVMVRQHVGSWNRLDYRLVQPEPASRLEDKQETADPNKYRSRLKAFRQSHFRHYVEQIDDFPDAYFDLIIIDGRARPSCIMHSISKVKEAGIIVLDNADRAYYTEQTGEYLAGFRRREFRGAVPCTPRFEKTDLYFR